MVAAPHAPALVAFAVGSNQLAVEPHRDDDRKAIAEQLAEIQGSFDLSEPFGRIREAIEEAQQAVR